MQPREKIQKNTKKKKKRVDKMSVFHQSPKYTVDLFF